MSSHFFLFFQGIWVFDLLFHIWLFFVLFCFLQQKAIADSWGSSDIMKVEFGKFHLVAECRLVAECNWGMTLDASWPEFLNSYNWLGILLEGWTSKHFLTLISAFPLVCQSAFQEYHLYCPWSYLSRTKWKYFQFSPILLLTIEGNDFSQHLSLLDSTSWRMETGFLGFPVDLEYVNSIT